MIKNKSLFVLTTVLVLAFSLFFATLNIKSNEARATTETFDYELDLSSAPKNKLSFSYVISDNMLYQQKKPAVVWGFCPAGKLITLQLTYQKTDEVIETKEVVSSSDGYFKISFTGRDASYTEYKIVATADGEDTITAEHILFGELYLSCGQSNMGFNVQYCSNADEIRENANNPYIRVYMAPTFSSNGTFSYLPTAYDSAGAWVCGDSYLSIAGASAVSYNFILKMYAELNTNGNEVPCGFLNTAKGATSIETWFSRASIENEEVVGQSVVKDYLVSRDRLLTKAEFNTKGSNNYNQVSAMFNSSIAPLSNLYVKGILWYQGENNVGNETAGIYYRQALQLLRKDWSMWYNDGTEELPLFFVALTPNNSSRGNENYNPENFGYMWEGMAEVVTDDPERFSMVTAYDVPLDWYLEEFAYRAPWHTTVKKPIGERLATYALNKLYDGFDGYVSAPQYGSVNFENGRAIVSFINLTGLKTTDGLDVIGFTLCGADRKFYPAKADILSDGTVSVYSEWVKEPVAVAYAFSMMIQRSNLCSSEGYVVAPFRSDKVASVYYSAKDWQNCDALQLWISKGSDDSRTPDLALFKDAYETSGNIELSESEDGYYGNAIKLDYTLRGREAFSFTPILHQDGVFEQLSDYDTVAFRVKNLQNRKLTVDRIEVTLANGKIGCLRSLKDDAVSATIEKGDEYQTFLYSMNKIEIDGETEDISTVRNSIRSMTIFFKDYLNGSILIDDFMFGNANSYYEQDVSPTETDTGNETGTDKPDTAGEPTEDKTGEEPPKAEEGASGCGGYLNGRFEIILGLTLAVYIVARKLGKEKNRR